MKRTNEGVLSGRTAGVGASFRVIVEPCGQERRNGRTEVPPTLSGHPHREDDLGAVHGEIYGGGRRQALGPIARRLRRRRTNRDASGDGSEDPGDEKDKV